ncbi:MAG: permease [Myxococcota bacterium]
MPVLVAGILALWVGPLLLRFVGSQRSRVWAALDAFVVTALLGLVGLHLLPEALVHGGWLAALLAVVGLLLPGLVEERAARPGIMAGVAVLGFGLHAMLDGAALAHGHHGGHGGEPAHHGELLALGVVLHRLPLGLALWWGLRPRFGARVAAGALAFVTAVTTLGFGAADLLTSLPPRPLAAFEGLVAGSLLHVVLGHVPTPVGRFARGPAATVGALAAAAVTYGVVSAHPVAREMGEKLDATHAFAVLALESAPALLVAFTFAGLLQVFIGTASTRWLARGNAATQAVKGMAFGLPLPICSCGVLPVYRSLVVKGVPAAAAMSFLVATPELGLDAILLSVPLLGTELTAVRVVAAALVAFVTGSWIGRMIPPSPSSVPPSTVPPDASLAERVRAGLRFGLSEQVDHIGPWVVAGLVIAALVEPLTDEGWLATLPSAVQVPVMAAVGLPTYVCASGATPLVAVLLHKGLSPGAAIAFLLTGPATNITTFALLRDLHGRRTAMRFGLVVALLAVALGFVVNALLGRGASGANDLHDIAAEGATWLQVAAAFALAGLFLASLWRQGPRGVLAQVLTPHDHSHHGHEHHHHG